MWHRGDGNMPVAWSARMGIGGGAQGQTAHEHGNYKGEFHSAFLSLVYLRREGWWLWSGQLSILGVCSDLRCALGLAPECGLAKYLVFDTAPGFVVTKRVGVRPLSEQPVPVLFRKWRCRSFPGLVANCALP
jgi:hypothetical protein